MTYLLPYIEHDDVYNQIDLRAGLSSVLPERCRFDPADLHLRLPVEPVQGDVRHRRSDRRRPAGLRQLRTTSRIGPGWGHSDYFATVYTDISDGSNTSSRCLPGNRDKSYYRADGALTVTGGSAASSGSATQRYPGQLGRHERGDLRH